ncbi:uncharacterized protein LOC127473544 isoform X10 [Manacus candei]|uniref:uncharacterized protein LOC127473544 isoform X10 n=1 Tax=Manacus candei TaxID=415023 RepID=UPI002226C563|nr:uncharacterized protein LOC127473544 isoform X10 [Manacus candei]
MALALRLFLPFLLAVALHARAAQAAPVPARGADENTGNASPLDWLRKVLQPLQPPAGVFAGRTFPAPLLVPRPKLLSHGTGPPRGKSQPPGEKKTHESNEVLKEIMKELQKGREMDQGALWQVAFPEGSSGSVPGSAEGREAMPGTGTRDENTGNASPLDWLRKVLQPLQPPAGVFAGRTFPAPFLVPRPKLLSHGTGPPRGKSQPPGEKKTHAAGATTRAPKIQESTGRDFCWGTGCLSVLAASMLVGLLVFMLCCAGIWYWRVRKRLLSAPAPAQTNTSGSVSWTSHLCSSCPKPAVLTRLKNGLLTLLVQLPQKRAPLPPSSAAPPSSPV